MLQVRAMQIIDELETLRRGPYGGGIGHVSFTGQPTLIAPPPLHHQTPS